MNPGTGQSMVTVYGATSQYIELPTTAEQQAGVVPLDTLPADWWNALWNQTANNNNAIYLAVEGIREELLNLLTAAGIEPSASTPTQVATAIRTLATKVATTTTPGSVLSSSDIKSISVNESTGAVIVNALSDWTGTDSVKTKIDSAKSDLESTIGAMDLSTVGGTGKYVESVTQMNGVVTATSQNTTVSASVNSSTKVLTITVNGVTATVDLSSIVTSATRATYARYLVPDDTSTSTAISAYTAGQLKADSILLA